MKRSFISKILFGTLLFIFLFASTPASSRQFEKSIDENLFITERVHTTRMVESVEFIGDENSDGLNEILLIHEDGTEEISYSSNSERSENEEAFDACQAPDNFKTIYVMQGREYDPSQEDRSESINLALDKLSEYGYRGRIVVNSGLYEENIQIPQGAHIIIEAENVSQSGLYEFGFEEVDQPEFVAFDGYEPTLSIASETTFCLNGISVRGDRAAIVAGTDEADGAAYEIKLNNTRIADSEYGIYGQVSQFIIENSLVEHNNYGLTIAGDLSIFNSQFVFNKTNIVSADSIKKAPPVESTIRSFCADSANKTYQNNNQVYLNNVTVINGKKGGISICNAGSATIKNTFVLNNQYVGVQIYHTKKFSITDGGVYQTAALNGAYGDNLVVVASVGDVINNVFLGAYRANLQYYDVTGGSIQKNAIMFGVFAINIENTVLKITTDNYLFGNSVNEVSSSALKIPPIPSVPKL